MWRAQLGPPADKTVTRFLCAGYIVGARQIRSTSARRHVEISIVIAGQPNTYYDSTRRW